MMLGRQAAFEREIGELIRRRKCVATSKANWRTASRVGVWKLARTRLAVNRHDALSGERRRWRARFAWRTPGMGCRVFGRTG
ncbi:hypothetical protein CEQ30_40605 [Nocardia brasiliensis]|nr:hypothetical protein CEQ30_40605 [Nocardia brasiliensis]